MMRGWWILLLVLLTPLAQAVAPSAGPGQGVHAFLNRTHISLGDTVTLNIQSHGAIGNLDLAPLQKNFRVLGASRSSSTHIVNGKTATTSQLGIALKPRRTGTLTIPALSVGATTTAPLTLFVAAAPAGGTGQVGDPVFMQASVLSSSPYVGQQTVYRVRLFYQPGVHGSLGAPHADGARLIRLDRDHRYTVERNGYAYEVIERSWALIPGRSGAITVQGPTFRGQNLGAGNLNSLLNNPQSLLNNPRALMNGPFPGFGTPAHATAPAVSIKARAEPAGAGKPWLPARAVHLKLSGLPANDKIKAGVPLTVTLQITAEGVPADALPEPELPTIAHARVYPDQTQDSTDNSRKWLQGTRTRRFAIVPGRDGKLTIPAITLNWWSVVHNRAEQARLPAHVLQVSGATAALATPPAPRTSPGSTRLTSTGTPAAGISGSRAPTATAVPVSGSNSFWRDLAMASFGLWVLVAIVMTAWWFMRHPRPDGGRPAGLDSGTESSMGVASATRTSGQKPPQNEQSTPASASPRVLRKQMLEAARRGDADACGHALLAWARALRPDIAHAGALHDALDDPKQIAALGTLQRVRWKGGDSASACALVAAAFAHGFVWRDHGKPGHDKDPGLPPLYPSA